MKNLIITLSISLLFVNIFGQQIGIGTNSPDTSAVLDIQSTSSGLLIPRMTTAQRNAIFSPANGLLVYDTNTNSFWFYNGSWNNLITVNTNTQNSLDQAYNEGGAGAGRKITANDSAVIINGEDGLYVTGTLGQGTDVEIEGGGTRMFFNPKKSAFRVGTLDSLIPGAEYWNNVNIGLHSIAMGYNTKASANYSVSIGGGDNGRVTLSSGEHAISIGNNTNASNTNSMALGTESIASGVQSIAIGGSIGSGLSISRTIASGKNSLALGTATTALGFYSTSMGFFTQANAPYSTSIGNNTIANGFSSTVIGQYNRPIVSTQNNFNNSTPLFIIGNGTDNISDTSNAFTVYFDGRVQINDEYTLPTTDGTANQIMKTDGAGQVSFATIPDNSNTNELQYTDTFTFIGTTLGLSLSNDGIPAKTVDLSSLQDGTGTDDQIIDTFTLAGTILSLSIENDGEPVKTVDLSSLQDGKNTLNEAYDEGGRGMGSTILADSGAVRILGEDGLFVGGVYGQGDSILNTGISSKMFFNPKKAAFRAGYSYGDGWYNRNVGNYSFSTGFYTKAKGLVSAAFGSLSTANGENSISLGSNTISNGKNSSSFGLYNVANGANSTVVGLYNDTIVTVETTSSAQTPLFIVGNGSFTTRNNAFVVFKNGKVGVGTNTPGKRFEVGANGDGTKARANSWLTFSDRRWKTNFKKIENPLDKISKINGYYYNWKNKKDKSLQVGVIAQEIEAVLPEIVDTDNQGYKSVDYAKIVALLIESTKAQQKEIENLKKEIENLKLK